MKVAESLLLDVAKEPIGSSAAISILADVLVLVRVRLGIAATAVPVVALADWCWSRRLVRAGGLSKATDSAIRHGKAMRASLFINLWFVI